MSINTDPNPTVGGQQKSRCVFPIESIMFALQSLFALQKDTAIFVSLY